MLSRISGERSEPVSSPGATPPEDMSLPEDDSAPEPAMDGSAIGEASRTALSDVEFLKQVGRGVASVYSDILGQPMPDRLVALLKRLEEEEDAPKSGNRSHL